MVLPVPRCPGAYLTRVFWWTPQERDSCGPCAPCTFTFPRYKLIYYMNSYLSRNATASRASQTDPQRADLGHVAHGGIRPSEVWRTAEPEPDQSSLASENDA